MSKRVSKSNLDQIQRELEATIDFEKAAAVLEEQQAGAFLILDICSRYLEEHPESPCLKQFFSDFSTLACGSLLKLRILEANNKARFNSQSVNFD
jgi:hypothetical protein